MFRSRLLPLACAAILTCAAACAHAAELGEAVVRSYIGQPLVADIELTGFEGDSPVEVRLARPDVYQGASIAMNPVLANVRMSVMRRDGRQFLHITSIAPVDAQYLHLFLDLTDGGSHDIRAATLWLTPDPKPATLPAPAPVIAKADPVKAVPVKAEAPKAAPKPAPVPVPVAPAPVAAAPAKPVAAPVLAAPVRPVIAPAAATCPKPRYSDEEVRSCAARDYKNAVLTAQIVELEDKVKVLQAALDPDLPAKPAAVEAAPKAVKVAEAPVADAAPVEPAPRPAAPPPIRTAKAKPPVEQAPADRDASILPRWLWNTIALLAASGAAAAVFIRRRRIKPVAVVVAGKPKGEGKLIGRLKEALRRDKKQPAAAADDRPEDLAA